MSDKIFFISSCINADKNIYNEEKRFKQNLRTIESINKYCPDSEIYIYDLSPSMPKQRYFDELEKLGTRVIYTGTIPDVYRLLKTGNYGSGEALSLFNVMLYVSTLNSPAKRFYCISSGFVLNDNFESGFEHTNKLVFPEATTELLSDDIVEVIGTDKKYRTNLFHMDSSLLQKFLGKIPTMINESVQYSVNIEFMYYKHLHADSVELEKIGVSEFFNPQKEFAVGENVDPPPYHYVSGEGLPDLINTFKKPVGIEVGSDHGLTTHHILKNTKAKLFCVDPYQEYVDWNGLKLNEREDTYKKFIGEMEQYGDRMTHIRKMSDNAVDDFKDDSYDFIFIDGLHTYDQVKKDMENFYPKIKSGGLFAGHDYMLIPGVYRAVQEFADKVGQKVVRITNNDVWYWFKP